jgi:hypothetical protein
MDMNLLKAIVFGMSTIYGGVLIYGLNKNGVGSLIHPSGCLLSIFLPR